ncbi:MAG: hypothetical protein PHH71_01170 [Clostridia bacterium]|nr:hypothetical protein [Clostridia bacterium]MDD3232150.1 hypothetical protein [Clostridia bacterium]MDD3862717.1 hypothetical protein [Clostridia bacterium]MDD4408333.1 hypothetical protein [Clostridia bacterium]
MTESTTIFNDIYDIEKFLENNFKGEEKNYESKIINKSILSVNIYGYPFIIEYKPNKSLILKYPSEKFLGFIKNEIMPVLSVLMAKTPFASYKFEKDNGTKIVSGCVTEWNVEDEKERFETLFKYSKGLIKAFPKIKINSLSSHRDSIREIATPFQDIQFPNSETSEKEYLSGGIKNLSNPAQNHLLKEYSINNDLSIDVKNERMNFIYETLQSATQGKEKRGNSLELGIAGEIYPGDLESIERETQGMLEEKTTKKQEGKIGSTINPKDTPQLGASLIEKGILNPEIGVSLKTKRNYEIGDTKSTQEGLGNNVAESPIQEGSDTETNDAEFIQESIDIETSNVPIDTTIKGDKPIKNEKVKDDTNIIEPIEKTPSSTSKITTFELNDTNLSDSFSIDETRKIFPYMEPYIRDDVSKQSKFLFYKVNGKAGPSLYGFNYNAQNNDERSDKYLGKISKIELNEQTGEAKIYYHSSLEENIFTPLVRQFSSDNIEDLNILMKKMQAKKSEIKQNENITESEEVVQSVGNPTIINARAAGGDNGDTGAATISVPTGSNVQGEIPSANPLATVENAQALKVMESTSALIRLWKEQGESVPQEFIEIYQDVCNTILNQSPANSDRNIYNIRTGNESPVTVIVGNHNRNIGTYPTSTKKKTNQGKDLTI